MYLCSLALRHFRLFEEERYEFSPATTAIVGNNGRGKTTLLEAISLLSCGSSFRTPYLQETIQRESGLRAVVEGSYVKFGVTGTIKVSIDSAGRRAFHNNSALPSIGCLLGILPAVIVAPDDAYLIKGPPQLRRDFLNLFISQQDPLYVHHLLRYHRAVKQRNLLLKAKNRTAILAWEHNLAHAAAYLCCARRHTIALLQQRCDALHRQLFTGRETVQLEYKQSIDGACELPIQELQQRFITLYDKWRYREMEQGQTAFGPHKDDLEIKLNGQSARNYASEGQIRSLAVTLRFAQWHQMWQECGVEPLMLIDDIGIGMDDSRRATLYSQLPTFKQVLVTATAAPAVIPHSAVLFL